MASKTRSAAAKKAWATRRKLYGKSGLKKSSSKNSTLKPLSKKRKSRFKERVTKLNKKRSSNTRS